VSYGTFRPRSDGALFPEPSGIEHDFSQISEAGFTVVRTYTEPPGDLLEAAGRFGLSVLAGIYYPDWRDLIGSSRRGVREVARSAEARVTAAASHLKGYDQVIAVVTGNELPADVIRWTGTNRVASLIDRLVQAVRHVDPDRLITYGNYPTAEYLPLDSLDFMTFNVFLEERHAFGRYLTRLQHLAGDRPLVLGELGMHCGNGSAGEQAQAEALDWQLEEAVRGSVAGTSIFSWTDDWWVGGRQVEGWHFGLTREDRSPRPALAVAGHWNHRDASSLKTEWPSLSVVVCAYNAEETIDECLQHTCALDYPDFEVVVVDDGSSDATAEIARRHPRARVVTVAHAGLSVARNHGIACTTGDVIAFLDSDAYPSPEWPYFLALGLDHDNVGAVGGPNLPPEADGVGAQQVAMAPGGPVHVLLSDDRAEHVPGCNMAFRRDVIEGIGSFDPIFTAAGDDVDVCWKLLDRGHEIGFEAGALVWHHRRRGLRAYLRQQRGYGKAEALVASRHPDRFNAVGTARWRGRIYGALPPTRAQRVYRGSFGTAAFQSVYRSGGHALDIAHQSGVPLAAGALVTAPLAVVQPVLAIPAAMAAVILSVVAALDWVRVRAPGRARRASFRFRSGVVAMHLLQPLARTWGRIRHQPDARRLSMPSDWPLRVVQRRVPGGGLLLAEDAPRDRIARAVVSTLRQAGFRLSPPTGWEDHDGLIRASVTLKGRLQTSSHPAGCVPVRVRRRLRLLSLSAVAAGAAVLFLVQPWAGAVLLLCGGADAMVGWVRTGPMLRRCVIRGQPAPADPIQASRAAPAFNTHRRDFEVGVEPSGPG
jgi:GT2 family glycosyltransferase